MNIRIHGCCDSVERMDVACEELSELVGFHQVCTSKQQLQCSALDCLLLLIYFQ